MATAGEPLLSQAVTGTLPNFATGETSRSQRRLTGIIAMLMVAFGSLAIIFGRTAGPVVTAVLPMLVGCVIITELMSAYVLLSQFLLLRYSSLALMGAAYLYSGLLVIPYILTFPKVFSPTGLFHANDQTALTLWALWHIGFPALILAYALVESRVTNAQVSSRKARLATVGIVLACLTIAGGALFFTTHFRAWLPHFIENGHFTALSLSVLLPPIVLLGVAAIVALSSGRRRLTAAAMWLSLAVLASLFDSVIGLLCQRYSWGWYSGKVFAVASSSLILGAFVYEFLELYRKLATANNDLKRMNALERQQAHERLEYLAQHDALTGLHNRARLHEELEESIKAAERGGYRIALLYMDLDHFKDVNDALSQSAGDDVLVEVAARLRAVVRPDEPVARIGGDEFASVLKELSSPSDSEAVASRFRESLRKPFCVGAHVFHLSASIGIALYPDDGSTAETLINHADAAAYRAKKDGGDGQQFFSHEIAEQMRIRRSTREGLVRALEHNEFVLHYQPLLDLHSGKIRSAEALIRWQDPVNGMIAPNAFIGVAEESGLMVPIGDWVLQTALRQAYKWSVDSKPIRVSVNVSARQFQDKAFFSRLCELLALTSLEPNLIDLEVTESVAMADFTGNATLKRCKELGLHLSLDDFGTHYSSLAYLRQLPVDSIKIDRSFVQGVPFNREDVAIVRAIIALGKSLDREIVAEGVETVEQLNWFRDHGGDVVQGYLIAKPMQANAWDELLPAWQSRISALTPSGH